MLGFCYSAENHPMHLELIDAKPSSYNEALTVLEASSKDTPWAEKTNPYVINAVRRMMSNNEGSWTKGLLPEDALLSIVLPEHGHRILKEEPEGALAFDNDTTLRQAADLFINNPGAFPVDCREHIASLQASIRREGFTSSVLLLIKDGQLRHGDGLHRLIALATLMREGFTYKPIPVLVLTLTP